MPIDHPTATRHHLHLDSDYANLVKVGISAIRDGMPWPAIESKPGRYDWKPLDHIIDASGRHGMQTVYDLCHFGYPTYLDVFSNGFVDAFAEYCYETAQRLARRSAMPYAITALNEPSYFAWAGGDAGLFAPHRRGCAPQLKVQLVRALIAGLKAIRSVSPDVPLVNVDPICRSVAPRASPELQSQADAFNAGAVLESWDMLSGRLLPELGGSSDYLGIVGVNYYCNNQWEFGNPEALLAADDERRWPLYRLVEMVWERYRAPMIISETGHIGDARASWLRELAQETTAILGAGIPLHGVCLYPVLGMPAWHAPEEWLRMGLWDVCDGERVPYRPMLEALVEFQRLHSRRRSDVTEESSLPPLKGSARSIGKPSANRW